MTTDNDARPRRTVSQTQMTRDPSVRQLAETDRDGRKVACPDCGKHVGHSNGGGKEIPGREATCFGWECKNCNLTLPANSDADATGFNDRFGGLKVRFRDGNERFVPVPTRFTDDQQMQANGGRPSNEI